MTTYQPTTASPFESMLQGLRILLNQLGAEIFRSESR